MDVKNNSKIYSSQIGAKKADRNIKSLVTSDEVKKLLKSSFANSIVKS